MIGTPTVVISSTANTAKMIFHIERFVFICKL
jgi:hypothetical protein